jgi:FKBP-type peptidyl-prolyl cis-trans isomerase SlyD
MKVSQGTQVSVEFTVSLDDQTVVGSNVGDGPLVFTHGAGEMFPALEQGIEGMEVGETKQVALSAEQAYGPVHPEAIQRIEKSRVPEGARQVGAELRAQGTDGEPLRARVTEVGDEVVVVDFNHPLAGKNLSFEVKVLDVQTPSSND